MLRVSLGSTINAKARFLKRGLSSSINTPKRVGIIGGGVAGLQAAKCLAANGIECFIVDKAPKVGGLWQSNYSSYGLQVPKQLYEFPDFKFNKPVGYFPTGAEVQQYIEEYATVNNLNSHVRLETTVVKAVAQEGGQKGWKLTLKDNKSGGLTEESVDYLIVSTGMYSNPNLPKYEGQSEFEGQVIHSSAFTDNAAATQKHVIVVGGAKSAIDLVLETSRVSKRSAIVFNQAQWGTPRKIAGVIPFQYVFLSRLGQALVSWRKGAWPTAPASVHTAHTLAKGIMGPIFGIVEALFAFQLWQYGANKPKYDVVQGFYGYGHVLDSSFKKAIKSKAIDVHSDRIVKLNKTSAVLASGKEVPADLIVCATGFQKSYDYFDDITRTALGVESDGLYLYRHCLPANVPNLAFIGSEVASISNIMTHGIQSEWVVRQLTGKMPVPTKQQMVEDIETMKKWKRSWMPETSARASLVLLHQTHYHDTLLKDMGIAHRRKGANVLAELFMPYQAGDYDGIMSSAKK